MKKLTVIMPAFNAALYIKESIESVAAQKHTDLSAIEIIVINDGSTDNTAEVVKEIMHANSDLGIVFIDLPENRGVLGAAYEGLKAASGEFIALLDADDIWSPDKLSASLGQGCDVVVHEGHYMDSSGRELKKRVTCPINDDKIPYYTRSFRGSVPLGSSLFFRRAAFDMKLFETVYSLFESDGSSGSVYQDLAIMHTLMSAPNVRVKCIRRDLYCYRVHPGNANAAFGAGNRERMNRVVGKMMKTSLFGLEVYKRAGLCDKQAMLGHDRMRYFGESALRSRGIVALMREFTSLQREGAFDSPQEEIKYFLYPFFCRLPVKFQQFLKG